MLLFIGGLLILFGGAIFLPAFWGHIDGSTILAVAMIFAGAYLVNLANRKDTHE